MKSLWTSPFRREIVLALAVKTMLLLALWAVFFSHPQDKRLTPDTVTAGLLERGPSGNTLSDPKSNEVKR